LPPDFTGIARPKKVAEKIAFWLDGFNIPGYEMDDDLSWEFLRVRLMQLFRWTPDEVDNLSQHDVGMIFAVMNGQKMSQPEGQWFA